MCALDAVSEIGSPEQYPNFGMLIPTRGVTLGVTVKVTELVVTGLLEQKWSEITLQ